MTKALSPSPPTVYSSVATREPLPLLLAVLVRPQATLPRLTTGPGQVWLPLGAALLIFYGQAFALAAFQQTPLDWRFAGGVVNLCLGWPLRTFLLAILVRWLQGRPALLPLLLLSAWATLPLTLRNLGQTLYLIVTGHPVAHPGLAGLLAGADPALPLVKLGYFVLGWIDLFTLWHLALLVVTVRIAADVTTGRAIGIVALYSGLFLLSGGLLALLI